MARYRAFGTRRGAALSAVHTPSNAGVPQTAPFGGEAEVSTCAPLVQLEANGIRIARPRFAGSENLVQCLNRADSLGPWPAQTSRWPACPPTHGRP
jgi:hypothetical protein